MSLLFGLYKEFLTKNLSKTMNMLYGVPVHLDIG